MVDQDSEWARQWAVTTGRCVRRWRTTRKLSGQKLADRCAELGLPGLTRAVITKLENGRKESVSTAELIVLAKALGVPPVMLMFPFGEQRMAEITPGEFIEPLAAAYWVAGVDPGSGPRAAERGTPLDLYIIHDQIAAAMLSQRRLWQDIQPPPWKRAIEVVEVVDETMPAHDRLAKEFWYNVTLLRTTRDALSSQGFEPPPLPPILAKAVAEAEEGNDGSR